MKGEEAQGERGGRKLEFENRGVNLCLKVA